MKDEPIDDSSNELPGLNQDDLENIKTRAEQLRVRTAVLKKKLKDASGNDDHFMKEAEIELDELEKAGRVLELELIGFIRKNIDDYDRLQKRSEEMWRKLRLAEQLLTSDYRTKQTKLNTFLASSIGTLLILGNITNYSKTLFLGIIGVLVFITAVIWKYYNRKYKNLLQHIKELEAEHNKGNEYVASLRARNEEMQHFLAELEKGGEE